MDQKLRPAYVSDVSRESTWNERSAKGFPVASSEYENNGGEHHLEISDMNYRAAYEPVQHLSTECFYSTDGRFVCNPEKSKEGFKDYINPEAKAAARAELQAYSGIGGFVPSNGWQNKVREGHAKVDAFPAVEATCFYNAQGEIQCKPMHS